MRETDSGNHPKQQDTMGVWNATRLRLSGDTCTVRAFLQSTHAQSVITLAGGGEAERRRVGDAGLDYFTTDAGTTPGRGWVDDSGGSE